MKTLVAAAAVLAGITFSVASSQAQPPPAVVFAADRAPTLTGEIYRLDPNGHRVDLSKSPSRDTSPSVSPDGKRVAFLSDRGGADAVYEVGVDGHGLVRAAAGLAGLGPGGMTLAWQPHGPLLAVATTPSSYPNGHVWLVRPHRKPLAVSRYDFALWSADGRVLLVWNGAGLRALSPAGRALWNVPADEPSGSWSAHGLLAAVTYRGIGVWNERGRRLFGVAIGRTPSHAEPVWSPDGSRLALLAGNRIAVVTAAGKAVIDRTFPQRHGIAWMDDEHLAIGGFGACGCQAKTLDLRTGALTAGSARWFDTLSPDHKLAIVVGRARPPAPFAVGVEPARGGAVRTYGNVPGCYSDGDWIASSTSAGSPQFAGRSLVYESWGECDEPFANLYSVPAGGGPATRLTDAGAQETQPALSPNGAKIAYVWASATGLSCKGCSDGIRVVGSDGKSGITLTDPEDCTFDDSPTWSPDGGTILYAETTCSAGGELFTIPAGGGTPHDLHVAGTRPAWGPARIAFEGAKGLMTAKPDGSDPVLVARTGSMPAWSPAGRLAYLQGSTKTSLVVAGSKPVKLPFARVTSLLWTRDGTRLVVTATKTRHGAMDVYTVRTDGTHPVRLTKNYGAAGAWATG